MFVCLNGVWFAGPIADLSASLIVAWLISRELRHLRQLTENSPAAGLA